MTLRANELRRYKDSKYLVHPEGYVINGVTGKVIKDQDNGRGYRKVTLTNNGTQTQMYVHRLVSELFIDNPNGYDQVNHKDGNKSNNRVENLEWSNSFLNIRHAINSGLFLESTEYWSSKLSVDQISQIRNLSKQGVKGVVLAKMFAVSKSTISEIKNRKRHKRLTGEELTLANHPV